MLSMQCKAPLLLVLFRLGCRQCLVGCGCSSCACCAEPGRAAGAAGAAAAEPVGTEAADTDDRDVGSEVSATSDVSTETAATGPVASRGEAETTGASTDGGKEAMPRFSPESRDDDAGRPGRREIAAGAVVGWQTCEVIYCPRSLLLILRETTCVFWTEFEALVFPKPMVVAANGTTVGNGSEVRPDAFVATGAPTDRTTPTTDETTVVGVAPTESPVEGGALTVVRVAEGLRLPTATLTGA